MDIRAYNTTASSNTADFPEGMAPSAINDEARELQAEIAQLLVDEGGTLTTGGSSNAYTLTLSTTPGSLADGLTFSCTANHTNTGNATLVVTPSGGSAFASKKIKKKIGVVEVEIVPGDIGANAHLLFQYDSAADSGTGAYLLLNPAFPNAIGRAEITSATANAAFALSSSIQAYKFSGIVIPSTATATALAARISTNSGSSYFSGASDYMNATLTHSNTTVSAASEAAGPYIDCSRSHAITALPIMFDGVFQIGGASLQPSIAVHAAAFSGGYQNSVLSGRYVSAVTATNIRFELSSGANFAAGTRILIEAL